MLSRIAASLYWVGRYVERADDTARILDVHLHRLLEDPSVEEAVACRMLLDVMGVPSGSDQPDASMVMEVLALNRSDTWSIAGSLTAARENARGAREAVSSEMWECLNATYNSLPAYLERAVSLGPHGLFRFVKDRAAIMSGLADSTMSRDDGWRFLVLGRSLERVDMTTRMLLTTINEPSGSPDWVTTLRSCSAHEAFLRTYRRGADASLVAEFLVLDRLFPRSVFHSLGVAEACLAELGPTTGRAGPEDEARRMLGRARTELEFRGVGELLADLPVHLSTIQQACADAGRAVAGRFFRQTAAQEWSLEDAVGRP